MDKLELTWEIKGGSIGTDDDPYNPLSRAIRQLFTEGKPFMRLVLCFCFDRRKHTDNPIMRWLGVFVLSAGKQIVFFPGFQQSKLYVLNGYRGKDQVWKEYFDFDHITMEPGHRRWHITSRDSTHRKGPRSTALGKQRFLWCGLSVKSLDELRVVKSRTKVIGCVPESDAKRRWNVFAKARNQAVDHILKWHSQVWEQDLDGYWHFGLIIAPLSSSTYMGRKLGFPEGSPFMNGPRPTEHVRLPVRNHRLKLSSEIGLQITTAVVPGCLRVPIIFTAPQEPSSHRISTFFSK